MFSFVYIESLNSSSSVPVKALCLSTHEARAQEAKSSSPPPVCGGLEERCRMALEHVAAGLQCLQYFDITDQKDRQDTTQVYQSVIVERHRSVMSL